ncbi:MAG TPA: homoserine dehydrogenase [Gaiellaceae bacterium]|jgi:homoserine dehydrogenase|nr:homoserine dehydrogenase [Gaiellaceae bacterium]
MASVDVGVGLLGYGTVGAAVARMLSESGDEIERATGHRLRVVRALVRDPAKERSFAPEDGVLTSDFATLRDDPAIDVVAEVMGGLDPAGSYVRELLRSGKPVVSANKQLVAREGADLFAIASAAGVQLRFEASVCAAVPVVKVLRESLVAENVHRILGIVNGTTNFVLSRMERGGTYAEALAEAQSLGFAEADPTDDVTGADAAAKMAILATVAFGSRVVLDDVQYRGIDAIEPSHVAAAAEFGMAVKLIGIATLIDDSVDVRVQPAFVERAHPLAGVDGSSNAVVLQGDAIREVTLGGPGAGGLETASAVVADLVSVVGTSGTGFLQNDACWRELPRLDPARWSAPFYVHLDVADRPGVLGHAATTLAKHNVSVAQLVQHLEPGRAALDLVLHDAAVGDVEAALSELASSPEVLGSPFVAPVIAP